MENYGEKLGKFDGEEEGINLETKIREIEAEIKKAEAEKKDLAQKIKNSSGEEKEKMTEKFRNLNWSISKLLERRNDLKAQKEKEIGDEDEEKAA